MNSLALRPTEAKHLSESQSSVAFTIVHSQSGDLTKTFRLDSAWKITPTVATGLTAGTAHRIKLAGTASEMADKLARWLVSIQAKQALIPAPPPGDAKVLTLATDRKAEGNSGVIARTKEYFRPPQGPALLAIDLDFKGYPEEIRAKLGNGGNLSKALASVFPPIGDAACVTRASVSSGIRNCEKNEDQTATGQHRYFFVLDGEDAPGFSQRLSDHLALAGWIWGEVLKSGAVAFRTLFDVAASSDPSRLFYEANAILEGRGLEHIKGARDPKTKAGGFLDTRALRPLSEVEQQQLAEIKERIKRQLEPKCASQRERWRQERIAYHMRKGISPETAQRLVSGAIERQTLDADCVIELDSGQSVTVREILENRPEFHKKTCADPLEPDYHGGRNIAVIYTDGPTPRIFSHAHGGIDYRLSLVEEWFDPIDEPPDTAASDKPAAEAETIEPLDIFGHSSPANLGELPQAALPPLIYRWACSESRRKGVPLMLPSISALTTVGAAIGNSVRIQPREHDTSWTEPAGLWVVLVCDPGRRKSPTIDGAIEPLRALDQELGSRDEDAHARWSATPRRKGDGDARGPEPRVRRFMVDDVTLEQQIKFHRDNPRGVLRAPDELVAMLGSLGAYKRSGEGDRSKILSMFDGRGMTVDRVTSGTVRAVSALMSIIAGTQPEKIQKLTGDLGADGFLQRCLFILDDDQKRASRDEAPDHAAKAEYSRAIRYLATAGDALGVVRLSPAGYAALSCAQADFDRLRDLPGSSTAWKGHVEKWGKLLPRFVLIFHALAQWELFGGWAIEQTVCPGTIKQVAAFCRYVMRHSLTFYERYYGRSEAASEARKLAGHFLTKPEKLTFTTRDIAQARTDLKGQDNRGKLLSAMRELEYAGWCDVAARNAEGPTSWRVNPLIHTRFAEHAEREKLERAQKQALIREAAAARNKLFSN